MTTTNLSAEQREAIEDQIIDLSWAISQIRTISEPLRASVKPYDDAIARIEGAIETLLTAHGLELAGECEGCDCMLFRGADYAHQCEDGPLLCMACAPTRADVRRQLEERLAKDQPDEEQRAAWETAIAAIDDVIAAGGSLDEKQVWPL